jgi:hypothetical protein
MYLLDDSYNIAKLFYSKSESVPDDIKNALAQMFNIGGKDPRRRPFYNPFLRFAYDMERISISDIDRKFIDWACKNIIGTYGYAGLASPKQVSSFHGGKFHSEFIFCNAVKWMERDLSVEYDWQKLDTKVFPRENKKLMKTYRRFLTLNTNYHGGNLYEHSVWCLLFYEMLVNDPIFTGHFTEEEKFGGAIAAYLHDIGKMNIDDPGVQITDDNKYYVFFNVKKHPKYGEEMVLGELPMYNFSKSTMSRTTIDLNLVIKEILGNPPSEWFINLLAFIIYNHWDYGSMVVAKSANGIINEEALQKYAAEKYESFKEITGFDNVDYYRQALKLLILISAADIAATRPIGKGNIASGIKTNIESTYLNFITNMPQIYRGTNLYESAKVYDITVDAFNSI